MSLKKRLLQIVLKVSNMGIAKRKYHSLPRTAKEVFMNLPEGTLAELINNAIYILPMPDLKFHAVRSSIASGIWQYNKKYKLGTCVAAPLDIFLDENIILQPDILFILKSNLTIIKNDLVKGAPNLIIEILSPRFKKHDTVTKKSIYEKFGVKEYFIVDPETKETITWYLVDKKYVKQQSVKGKIKSKLLKKNFSF